MSDGFTITGCDSHCLANGCARQELRDEIERLRRALEIIAEGSADELKRLQAVNALANIGPRS